MRGGRSRTSGHVIALVCAVLVLPMPLAAVSRLALPLPEVIERVAASLVPGGGDVAARLASERSDGQLRHGTIVKTASELRAEAARVAATEWSVDTARAAKKRPVSRAASRPKAPASRPS